MAIKIKKVDVIWGYLGTFLNNGINILILPFVLVLLPSNELGLWYAFTAIAGLALLIDFGFTATLTRNVSYSWSGAESIKKTGVVTNKIAEPNINLFTQVLGASKLIYFITSLIIFIILSTAGTAYINSVAEGSIQKEEYLLAWTVYILAVVTNIYFAYWTPVLKGIGALKEDYQSILIGKVFQLFICIIGLLLGYKLLAVAVAYFVGNLVKRLFARYMFYNYFDIKPKISIIKESRATISEKINTFRIILPSAYKQGVMSISKFFTDKFAVLIVTAFFGLEMAATFGLSMQLFGILGTVATVLYSTFLPYFSQSRISNDSKNAYKFFSIAVGTQSLIILLGGLAMILIANPLLDFIGSKSTMLSFYPALLLLIFFFIHYNQNIFVSFIITSNKMPMFRAYYISAILAVTLQYASVYYFDSFGVWSVIVPLLIVECAYNAWKWPLYVFKEFKVTPYQFYSDAIKNIIIKFTNRERLIS
ncbi:O-unit flippase-like protein [Planococcus plakortidis]